MRLHIEPALLEVPLHPLFERAGLVQHIGHLAARVRLAQHILLREPAVRAHHQQFLHERHAAEQPLEEERPGLVGLSCLTDFMPTSVVLIRAAKELGAATVMGGPHPTIAPQATMTSIPELDYALVGEAEKSLPALAASLEAGGLSAPIPGLYYREGGEVRLSAPPEIIEDLDWVPIPDRELLDVNREYLRARAINLHASRGCPFRCRFCQPTLERMFGKKVRFMGPARVAAEIEFYHQKYGFHDFFFHDDTFTINKKWLAGLVEALGRKDLVKGFRYVVNSRVDTFDEERAALLKEMGVYYVLFGLESGSQAVLDSIAKGTTLEEARQSFRICRKFKFRTHAYVLLGAPSETSQSLKATEDFVAELRPNTVPVSYTHLTLPTKRIV